MNVKFKVVSDSMHPLIKIGQLLTLAPRKPAYKTFDMIVFRRGSNLVVHYVWRDQSARNNTVVTRSLKNIYSDEEPVGLDEIVGEVCDVRCGTFLRLKIVFQCLLTGNY